MLQESNQATTLYEENDKYQVYHQAPSTTTHRQIQAKFPLSDTKLGHLCTVLKHTVMLELHEYVPLSNTAHCTLHTAHCTLIFGAKSSASP